MSNLAINITDVIPKLVTEYDHFEPITHSRNVIRKKWHTEHTYTQHLIHAPKGIYIATLVLRDEKGNIEQRTEQISVFAVKRSSYFYYTPEPGKKLIAVFLKRIK